MREKLLFAAPALAMCCGAVISTNTSAASDTCDVRNGGLKYTSINEAVKNASAGDTLKVYPGVCDITRDDSTMVEGQAGWYLPITKSLTIMGVDNSGNPITDAVQTQATLYSSTWVDNGAWATQNLITIFADNVTISGLTLMDKPDGNKTIEIVDGVNGFTIKDSTFAPLARELITDEMAIAADYANADDYFADYQHYGAALYFTGNVTNAKVTGNIFDHSGLTFDHTNNADIAVTGNTFFGVKQWSGPTPIIYKSVNYTNWGTTNNDLTNFDLTFTSNKLIESGTVDFSKATAGSFNFNGNYWGSANPDFASLIVLPETEEFTATLDTWYTALNEDGSINEDSIYPPVPTPEPTPVTPGAPDTGVAKQAVINPFVALAVGATTLAATIMGIKRARSSSKVKF